MTSESSKNDQSFNESELQDIMSEIESLEQEVSSHPESSDEKTTDSPVEEAEASIEQELQELESETTEDVSSDDKEERAIDFDESELEDLEKDNVVPLNRDREQPPMSLNATGEMNLNMNFQVGGAVATISVDDSTGVAIKLNGVHVTIHPEDGCKLKLDNGLEFSMPLDELTKNHQKKAA